MKYSLDTNTCIRYLNGRAPAIQEHISSVPARDIIVCSVVRGELAFGAARSQTPDQSAARQAKFLKPYASLPFDDTAAQVFGRLRAELTKRGTPIGPYDLLIASIAIAYGLIVVTHNTREYSRIPGLPLEDWEL